MSSLLYGSISRERLATAPDTNLRYITSKDPQNPATSTVNKWQDVLAGLVPAEVLGLHAVAMSYGTKTTGSGEDAKTVITEPQTMVIVYVAMLVLSAGLYLVAAKSYRKQDFLRALVPPVAFVFWTMIQPSTAFDAFPFELSTFARVMIAVIGAVVLSAIITALATKAEDT